MLSHLERVEEEISFACHRNTVGSPGVRFDFTLSNTSLTRGLGMFLPRSADSNTARGQSHVAFLLARGGSVRLGIGGAYPLGLVILLGCLVMLEGVRRDVARAGLDEARIFSLNLVEFTVAACRMW